MLNQFDHISPKKVVSILTFLGFLIYFNAIFHPFVHDDLAFIVYNPNIGQWGDIGSYFFKSSFNVDGNEVVGNYYRPFLEILYRLQYQLFELNAYGFHFINIVLHIFNAWLVFFIFQRWFLSNQGAFLLSLFFLIHPIQTEAVACVSGISNLIYSFFLLFCLCIYPIAKTKRSWRIGFLISFMLGMLSKEQTIVLPAIIIIYEWALNRATFKSLLKNKILLLTIVATIMYLIVRHVIFPSTASSIFNNPSELLLRLAAIGPSVLMYIKIFLFPVDLHYYRSIDILQPSWISWGILVMLGTFLVFFFKKLQEGEQRWLIFGLGWFFICLLPVLNIVPMINEYSYILTAEHFLYLPMIGLVLIFGVLLNAFIQSFYFHKVASVCVVLLIVTFSLSTVLQNKVWSSEIALFSNTLSYQPQLGRVHALMGKSYMMAEMPQEAIYHYDYALKRMNYYIKKSKDSRATEIYIAFKKALFFDLGQAYFAAGNLEASILSYQNALAIETETIDKIEGAIYNNIAMSHIAKKDFVNAVKYLEYGIKLDSQNLQLINNLALCYKELGELEIALDWFEYALQIDPRFLPAISNLKSLEFEMQR